MLNDVFYLLYCNKRQVNVIEYIYTLGLMISSNLTLCELYGNTETQTQNINLLTPATMSRFHPFCSASVARSSNISL